MRSILSVNDLHMGVGRRAGTTPQTMLRMKQDLGNAIEALLMAHTDKDVFINGDAFDAFNVDLFDIFRLTEICANWLDESGEGNWRSDPPPSLVISRGNHDISKDSSRMSAFDFMCAMLKAHYGDRVQVITEPECVVFSGHYVIPHMPNRALFDQAIEQAVEVAKRLEPIQYLHLHANFDNNFAVEEDHSLNVSWQQAKRLVDAGYHLIFGHEHQQGTPMTGVTIVGNQFPTSIADCLGNDTKHALIFHPDGSREEIRTWEALNSFVLIDWRDTLDVEELRALEWDFVRLTGTAKQEEAAAVLQAVSRFRQYSSAYVVSSSVKIEGVDDVAELEVAAADMKALDVLEYLYEQLEPEQAAVVKELLTKLEAVHGN